MLARVKTWFTRPRPACPVPTKGDDEGRLRLSTILSRLHLTARPQATEAGPKEGRSLEGLPMLLAESSEYQWHASADEEEAPLAVRLAARHLQEKTALRSAFQRLRAVQAGARRRPPWRGEPGGMLATTSSCYRGYVARLRGPEPLAFRCAARRLQERLALVTALGRLKEAQAARLEAAAAGPAPVSVAEASPRKRMFGVTPIKRLSFVSPRTSGGNEAAGRRLSAGRLLGFSPVRQPALGRWGEA